MTKQLNCKVLSGFVAFPTICIFMSNATQHKPLYFHSDFNCAARDSFSRAPSASSSYSPLQKSVSPLSYMTTTTTRRTSPSPSLACHFASHSIPPSHRTVLHTGCAPLPHVMILKSGLVMTLDIFSVISRKCID